MSCYFYSKFRKKNSSSSPNLWCLKTQRIMFLNFLTAHIRFCFWFWSITWRNRPIFFTLQRMIFANFLSRTDFQDVRKKTALTYHSSDCVRAKGRIVYCRLQPPSRGRREEKPQEIRVSKVAAPLLRPARIQVSGTRVTEMLEHYFKDVIKIARRYTRLISSLEYCG